MTTSDDKNLPLPLAPHGYCKVIYAKNIFDITDRDEFLHPIEDGEQLTDVLPNWEPETITATLNGEVLSRELWESRKIKSGDSVIVVRTPAGDDAKDILRLVLLIVVVIYAPQFAGMFGAEGTIGYAVAYVGFVVAGSLLINAILPPTMPDMADDGLDSSRSYGIDGAKNTAEEGIPMPICYGGFRMAGNIISLYTKNAGNTQYLYMLLNAGEGHVAGIRDIEINEQALTSYQHVETITKLGSETQEIIPWFGDTTTPIAVGATINTTFQTRTTGTIDAFRIDVVAPGGLIQYTDQGEKRTVTVPLEIEYKLTTDSVWTSLGTWGGPTTSYGTRNVYHGYNSYDTDGNVTSYTDRELRTDFRDAGDYYDGRTIRNSSGEPVGYYDEREYDILYQNPEVSGKRTSAIRTSFFSPKLPQGTYDVRVRRTTADSTDPQIVDNLTWSDLNEIIFDDVTYPYTALVAVKVKLTDQISSLPNITYYNEGKVIRAWNSTTDVWYDTPSQNPAWISLDMLTNTRYGAGISDSRIDIDRWRDWADYCDTKGLTFQGVFDTEMNVWDALNYVTRAGHAKVIRVGTKYSLAIDRETAPTQLFTVGNIIKDSFAQNWMSIIDRANEIEVQYFDQNDRNKRRTIKLYDDAIATGEVIKSSKITAWGVTDPDKAAKEGVYMLKNNRYIRSTVTFKAPLEAIAVTIGDVFLLQHDQPEWSGGGRLAAGSTTTTLEIDRPFTFDGAKSYTALVRFDSLSRYTAQITAITVGGRKLTLGAGFSGQTDIDRLTFGGIDIPITRIEADAVWVEDSTGLSVTDTVTLVQTDAIHTIGVTPATSGTLTSVPLAATLPATPAEYAPWAIGENTTVTSKWRVTRVDVHEDLTATINGAEYNEAIYDWTLTDAVIAPPSDSDRIVPHVQNLSVAEGFLAIGGVNRPTVEIGWTIDEDFEDYGGAEIQISYDGDAYTTVKTLTDGSTWTWVEVNGGDDLVIKVVAMSSDGRYALRSTAPTQAITISGDPYGPTDVANFTIVAAAVGIALSWDANTTDNDYAGIDIKRNTTNDEPGATLLFTSDANQTSYVDVGATDTNSSYYYWARSIDTSGNTGSWVASTPTSVTPNTIADGVDATTAWLTNPSATIPADSDGSNPNFTGTNGQFKVYKGINDITSTTTFSVFAADNATVTINTADNTPVNGQPRGYYEVTGESVAQDVHSITLRAVTTDAITIDQTFTVTKSLAGIDATAKSIQLAASAQTFSYDNSSGTPSLIGPSSISFTANRQNITGGTTWQAWDHTGTEITPVTNILSGIADGGATMTEANFAGITNNDFIRVRATADGIFDEVTVTEILSGQNGTIGNDAKLIAVGANSRTIYREAFEFGVPETYLPVSINFTANRQNITGGTTWRIYDDTGAELLPTSSYLSSMTDTSATFTSSQISSITNNDFIRVTATADGLTDEITIVSLLSAVHGVATYLSNETHVVEAEPDGSGADLSGFSGTHVVRQGYSNRTTDATHSVVGTATNDGLTLTVGATTGIYSFTGTWGTANDSYTWTLRAAFGGNNYDRELTITKSRKGAPGEASVVSYLTNEAHVVATANDGSGADLTGDQGGTHVVFDGLTDVTTSSVHSIVGGTDNGTNWTKTQNGVTMTIQEGTGVYDVSGTWTTATDTETFTLRATYNSNTYDKVYTLTKSKTGGDGTSPEVVTLSAEGNAFSYDNATGTPVLIGPTSIVLTVNEQNTVGATTWQAWDDTGAAISPIGNLLTSITDASATILESSFAGITNNDWVKVRATRDGVSDDVTIYRLSSGQDGSAGAAGWNTATLLAYKRLSTQPVDNPGSLTYTFASAGWTPANGWSKEIPTGTDPCWVVAATAYSQAATDNIDALEWTDPPTKLVEDGTDGTPGTPGTSPVIGILTNESHVVATDPDGNGYSYTNAGGTFQMWEGTTDVTGAGPTYSIVGGTDQGTTWTKTQNGLVMTINETSGVYSLSGTWTSDEESFTLRAVYSGATVDRTYTIAKSKTGTAGASAKALRINADNQVFIYTGFWNLVFPVQIAFTAFRSNSTATVNWKTQEWNGSAWVDTAVNRMSPTTGLSSTLTESGFTAENEESLRVYAWFSDGGTFEDTATVYRIRYGEEATQAYLTNEAHVVQADNDGTNYSLTSAGGTMVTWEGGTNRTTTAVNSIVGGTDNGTNWTKTQNGLTMTIQEGSGVYTLSAPGDSWTSDSETFTLRSTYRSIDYDRDYTISKSKKGVAGENAILISVSSDAQNFRYDTDGALIAPSTINFTAEQQGSTNTVSWKTQEWVTNAWVDTATNRMSPTTGLTSSLSEANFTLEGEDALRVVASFTDGATYSDSISVVRIQDGAQGNTGSTGAPGTNTATVFLYKRTTSSSAPAKPATPTSATYTFSTGVLDPNPWDGWSQEVPAYSGGADRWLWVTTATALSTTATDTINAGDWATPRELSYFASDVTTGVLTNEAHVVATASDGTGYSYTNAGGTFNVWSGDTDVTGAGPVYSIVNGTDQGATWTKTQNGLVMTMNETTGVYSLSGTWTSDEETFTLRAAYDGVNVDRTYTIAKSKAGTDGTDGEPPSVIGGSNVSDWEVKPANSANAACEAAFGIYLDWSANRIYAGVRNANSTGAASLDYRYDLEVIGATVTGVTAVTANATISEIDSPNRDIVWGTDDTTANNLKWGTNGVIHAEVLTQSGTNADEYYIQLDSLTDAVSVRLKIRKWDQPGGYFTFGNKFGQAITEIDTQDSTYSQAYINFLSGQTMIWKGSLASAPANPVLNWAYYNTTDGKAYIWDGDSWEQLSADGAPGAAAKSLTIESDSQVFKYDANDSLIGPTTINFTATRQNSSATVSWKTQYDNAGTWTDTTTNRMSPTTGLTSSLTAANFATEGEEVLRVVASMTDGSTYSDSMSIIRVKDGSTGSTGGTGAAGNSVATVFLYQRSRTRSAPAKPTSQSTYTFSNGNLSPDPLNGWSTEVPETTSDKPFLYVIQATASANTTTDIIEVADWSDPAVTAIRATGFSLISDADWALSVTDPMGAWDMSAGTVTNTTMHSDIIGPYGEYPLVMQIAGNGATPGWYSQWLHYHEYDKDKSYIYYVWVQRRSTDTDQGLYLGYNNTGAGSEVVANSTTGVVNSNPYFVANVGSQLTVGRWYLAVGVIHPDGTLVGDTGLAGIYDPYDYSRVYDGTEFEWNGQQTAAAYMRMGFYENTAPAMNTDDGFLYARPTAWVRDGTEPTVQEALRFVPQSTRWSGSLETRQDTGGVGNTTPRLLIQNATAPMRIYDTDDQTPLFELSGTGSGFQVSILGDFQPNSLNTAQGFSAAGIADLRGRLGLLPPSEGPLQTGGDLSIDVSQTAYSGTYGVAKYIYCDHLPDSSIGDIYSAGADVTLTFKIQGSEWGSGGAPDVVGDWDFLWEYSTNAGGAWTPIAASAFNNVTGDMEVFYEPGIGFDYSYTISQTRTYVWTAAVGTEGTPVDVRFRLKVTCQDGMTNGSITVGTASQPLANAGVLEYHTHSAADLTSGILDPARINATIISGQTETTTLAATDEILVNDAGFLRRADLSELRDVLDSYYPQNGHAETINGAWNFTTAPTKSGLGIPYYVTSTYTGGKISVQSGAPSSPTTGDLWFDTDAGAVAEVNDLTAAVTWANVPIANIPTGTTSSTVALGNHNHSGVYEPADADILKADVSDTITAEHIFTSPPDMRLGINGGYATVGGSTAYGATIWALDTAYDGGTAGSNSAITSVYGLRWIRSGHTNAQAAIGEGIYVYTNGVLEGGIGTGGIYSLGGLRVDGNCDFNGNIVGDGATTITGIEDITVDSTGDIKKTSHGNYLYHASTAYDNDQNGQITFGTGTATGGSAGDIHFQHEA